MLGWVTTNKPPFVVLENVCGAPWQMMCTDFEELGYQTTFNKGLDTKMYYCPQTRNRGYLVAMLVDDWKVRKRWNEKMVQLERQSSGSIEDFLLDNDDPRVEKARNATAWKEAKIVEWTRCKSRLKNNAKLECA